MLVKGGPGDKICHDDNSYDTVDEIEWTSIVLFSEAKVWNIDCTTQSYLSVYVDSLQSD